MSIYKYGGEHGMGIYYCNGGPNHWKDNTCSRTYEEVKYLSDNGDQCWTVPNVDGLATKCYENKRINDANERYEIERAKELRAREQSEFEAEMAREGYVYDASQGGWIYDDGTTGWEGFPEFVAICLVVAYVIWLYVNRETWNANATATRKLKTVEPDNIRAPEYFILDSQYLTKAGLPDFRYKEVKDMFKSKSNFRFNHKYDYINSITVQSLL